MDPGFVTTLVVASVASLFMAWVIGAGSSGATPFAPAVGANAIGVMRAGFVVGLLGFLGAVTQGGAVTEAVGTGLVDGVSYTPLAVILPLVIAAGLMAVGIYTGYPIATAFTVTGSIVGVGLALGGIPAWSKYTEIAALWVFSPFVVGGIAYAVARILPREDVPEYVSIPVLGAVVTAIVANVEFTVLGPADGSRSLASAATHALAVDSLGTRVLVTLVAAGLVALLVAREVRRDEESTLRRFLLALGGLVAFSAGASQVGLAVGPLMPLLGGVDVPLTAVLLGGGIGLLVGSWTGAPRMIKALAQDYSSLGPRRSIAALIPSFAVAQAAVFLGVPISFNEIIVSAIIGSGLAVGGTGGVSAGKMGRTVLAWAGSFALAFVAGYGIFVAVP